MQRMAKLMEHRRHIVERNQRRLAWCGFREVGHVVEHWLRPEKPGLLHECIHPRAAVLVVALEVVEVDEPEMGPAFVEDFEHSDVRLIDRKVLALLERETVKLLGGMKDA